MPGLRFLCVLAALTRSRKVEIPCDKTLYRQRHRIENMFGRLKDWRRIAMRSVS
jgi:transposase